MRHLAEQAGIADQVDLDSAGTINFHRGKRPDDRMRETGQRRGIRIDGAARQVTPDDLEQYDLVLAMDDDNLEGILGLPRADQYADRIHLFCEYTQLADHASVPDPYYGGQSGFDLVLDLLEAGCGNLVSRIQDGSLSAS